MTNIDRVLACLDETPRPCRKIALAVDIDTNTVSALLSDLVKRGRAVRHNAPGQKLMFTRAAAGSVVIPAPAQPAPQRKPDPVLIDPDAFDAAERAWLEASAPAGDIGLLMIGIVRDVIAAEREEEPAKVALPALLPPALSTRDRERIEEVEEELRQLRESLAPIDVWPDELGLTETEGRYLSALVAGKGRVMSKDALLLATREPNVDGGPEPKIVDVMISKLRTKLGRHGDAIETVWGQGHRATPALLAQARRWLNRDVDALVSRVLLLSGVGGDTATIAVTLGLSEAFVVKTLNAFRDEMRVAA